MFFASLCEKWRDPERRKHIRKLRMQIRAVNQSRPNIIPFSCWVAHCRMAVFRAALIENPTTYTLQAKGQISSSTIRRMKAGESVSTNTLDALCKILQCDLQDVVEYLPENNT